MKEVKLDKAKYLSEQIQIEQVEQWNKGKVVLDCATGMGKTTLINEVVAKVAYDMNACVLFLSSRTALTEQQKQNLARLGVTNVIVKTYQWLENLLEKEGDEKVTEDMKIYAFIVCDECHYFTNDATFNDRTQVSYNWIERQPTVIYMSATGDTVFRYMKDKHKVDWYYYTDMDYSKVSAITFCHSDEHMIECIEDIYNSGEKAIVFMDKLLKDGGLGTRIHTPVMDWFLDHQEDCHFMCSKYRKEYESINEFGTAIKDGKFDKQFLFCTQALDVGVDIKDPECKHAIVEMFDVDSVLQCLGRIRDKENAHYYIRVYDKQTLAGKAQTLKNNYINKAFELEQMTQDERWKYCMKGTRFNSNKGLFYIDVLDEKKIKVNELLLYKYEHIYEQYQTAMYGNGEDSGLSSHPHVGRWMSDFMDVGNFQGEFIDMAELDKQSGKNEINKYLESLEGVRLDKEGQKELIEKLDVRGKNGALRKTPKALNKWLMENDYDYIIINKKFKIEGKLEARWIVELN